MVTTCRPTLHDVSYEGDRSYLVRDQSGTGILVNLGGEYIVRTFLLQSRLNYVEYYGFRPSEYSHSFDYGEWFERRRTSLQYIGSTFPDLYG